MRGPPEATRRWRGVKTDNPPPRSRGPTCTDSSEIVDSCEAAGAWSLFKVKVLTVFSCSQAIGLIRFPVSTRVALYLKNVFPEKIVHGI